MEADEKTNKYLSVEVRLSWGRRVQRNAVDAVTEDRDEIVQVHTYGYAVRGTGTLNEGTREYSVTHYPYSLCH